MKTGMIPNQAKKRWRRWQIALLALGGWLLASLILQMIFGSQERGGLEFSIFPESVSVFGFVVSGSVAVSWVLITIAAVFLLALRIFVIPKFQDKPVGLQNIIELCVESVANYTVKMSGQTSTFLAAYMFGIGGFMVLSTLCEFVGVRAPTTDLTVTGLMGMITFLLFNYYGFKRKGVAGRFKALASPSPVIFPIKVISDVATPVSLACRLFGNMVGGMIVMDLVYHAMGNMAVGIPAVLAMFFSIFEPVIQIFIFITLSLNYIHESTE